MNTMCQGCFRSIERRCRIGKRVRSSGVHDVLKGRTCDRGAIGILRDRQRDGRAEIGSIRFRREVPATERYRITLRHKEGVAEKRCIGNRARVVSAHSTVESVDRFPSAIRRLVQHPVIALAEVHRLENIKVERVFDFAPGVPRRKLQIDDDRVFRILGIELAKCLSHDLFVLPDTRPRVAAESRRLLRGDLNLLHTRAGGHSHT